jgi:hypothetical protein
LKNFSEAKAEEQAKINVAERNEDEKINLCMRRGYTYLLQFICMFAGWFGIAAVCFFEDEL